MIKGFVLLFYGVLLSALLFEIMEVWSNRVCAEQCSVYKCERVSVPVVNVREPK